MDEKSTGADPGGSLAFQQDSSDKMGQYLPRTADPVGISAGKESSSSLTNDVASSQARQCAIRRLLAAFAVIHRLERGCSLTPFTAKIQEKTAVDQFPGTREV
ncbi:unnamed protein product [Heligmosomoides polygyrus]|uniref:Uncharacterized protein n=1 Tax=Heligmosomoides polygyrus TaxID=6339 RepID=A0A183G3H8_HELPZ|nr:unnamed protein product [Heligmosomoides polygyrus]